MIEAIKAEGYHTAAIGKNHFGFNYTTDKGVPHGFEYMRLMDGNTYGHDDYSIDFKAKYGQDEPLFCGKLSWNTWFYTPWCKDEADHPTAWVGRESVEYINNYTFDKPLFLKSSFHRPHSPYDPPERMLDLVDETKMNRIYKDADWDLKFKNLTGCNTPDAWCGDKNHTEVAKSRKGYLGNLLFVDEWIGHITDALEKKGQLNNTVIFFTSDHGDMQSDHYLWRKGYPYEGSTHIPMIMSWPGAKGAMVSDELVAHVDVFPTLYEVAKGN